MQEAWKTVEVRKHLFSRRAHLLTTHKVGGGIPSVGRVVRSARRLRLLWEPYGQCHNPASLLSLSTQLVVGVTTYKKYRRFNRRYSTNCLQKPATGSFVAEMGIVAKPHLLFLKSNKNKSERTVMKNGNLSSGSKGHQPWSRALRCGGFRISELFTDIQRLRWDSA